MKKKIVLGALLIAMAGIFGGCGKAESETAAKSAEETSAPEEINESEAEAGEAEAAENEETQAAEETAGDEVITVSVGTMGTYSPFSYVDENDYLTGYDIEVLRKVEEVDPSLHFEFTTGPWESLFVGLDSDKFQMLANQISGTDERREKYYLTENPYHTAVNQLIVKKGRTDINGFEDLVGKKIGLTVGDAHNIEAEKWNEENGNSLTLVYYEEDITTLLQEIVNGKIDATLNDPAVAISKAEIQGLDVEPVGERLSETPVFFIFKQDELGKTLQEKIDAALGQLIESGELSTLSTEWFEADYTPQGK